MCINMKCGIIVRCCEMQKKKKKKSQSTEHCAKYVPIFYVFSLLFFLKFRIREQ